MSELPDDVRRRLAEVFGEDLATSRDEREDGGAAAERPDTDDTDRWWHENRPPHHG